MPESAAQVAAEAVDRDVVIADGTDARDARVRSSYDAVATAYADQLLDELLSECDNPEQVLGKEGLLRQMTQRLMERALAGELTAHLGYPANAKQPDGRRRNTRNGSSSKTVLSGGGSLDLAIPRDREGTFEPILVPKGTRRLPQFDDQVIALYAQGLTTRQIQGHLLVA